jgi:pSer/pThr/pTyr-binding forkhead associated (FHA) protein
MWILRSVTESGREMTFRMPPGCVKTIGRGIRADFIVDAAMVSRVHCRLTADDLGQLSVEDLGSTNGTFVNDRRIRTAVLSTGDRLRLGRVELSVTKSLLPETGGLDTLRDTDS